MTRSLMKKIPVHLMMRSINGSIIKIFNLYILMNYLTWVSNKTMKKQFIMNNGLNHYLWKIINLQILVIGLEQIS